MGRGENISMQSAPSPTPPRWEERLEWIMKESNLYLLFVLLLACSVVGVMQVHKILVYQSYQPGRCTILSGEIEHHSGRGGPRYAPSFAYIVRTQDGRAVQAGGYSASYLLTDTDTLFSGSYSLAESRQIVGRYAVGKVYACWYNPAEPTHAVLAWRGVSFGALFGGLVVLAVLIFVMWLVLGLFFSLLYEGVYQQARLILLGEKTQGQSLGQVVARGRSKGGTRLAFRSLHDPSQVGHVGTNRPYPAGTWHTVTYDPGNLRNVKLGGRPLGCAMIFSLLCSLSIGLAGSLLFWWWWHTL
jgi:hypothetical protein